MLTTHGRAFRGAWIANVPADPKCSGVDFGNYTIAFTENIEKSCSANKGLASWPVLGPKRNLNVAWWKGDEIRCRGLQNDISLENTNLAVLSAINKTRKIFLRTIKEKFKFTQYRVISAEQLEFMQKKITLILGPINQSNQWRYNMPISELRKQFGKK